MSSRPATAVLVSRPGEGLRGRAGTLLPHVALLGAALAAWIDAIERADVGRISGYGLLPALPATYYIALVALAAGFLVAVSRRSASPALLAVYVLALVAVLHATTPMLYSEPRFAWTYKHLGAADYIAHFGSTDRSLDLYQNWPGFFALLALLGRASGASLFTLAPWAEPFFEAVYVAAVVFLVRGVSRDARVVWTAAWLFVLANWLGQGYFAPQSFAYLLYLVLIALCVRCAPAARRDPARWSLAARWWRRLQAMEAGRRAPFLDEPAHAPVRPASALLVGGLLFAAITISHQLSPLLCIVAVAAFAATTRRISLRPLIAMVVLELAWLAAAAPLLVRKYSLLDISPLERPVPAGGNSAWALPGMGASTLAARVSVAAVAALAVAGLIRRRRKGHFDIPIVAIAAAPALLIGVQAYSGEGIFRAYLFALPWLCFLAATVLVPSPAARSSRVLRTLSLAGATAVLGAATLFASFGREIVNYISPEDVAIEQWYERNSPPGSAVVYLAPNVPNRITYRYASKQVWAGSFSPSLTEDRLFQRRALGFADLHALEAKLRGLQATQAYVMIGPSQANYVAAFGMLPGGSVAELVAALRASADFQLVARHGDAYLFRLLDNGAGTR